MATQLFLLTPGTAGADDTPPGNLSADWDHPLDTARGASGISAGISTVNGPTAGIQLATASAAPGLSWWYRVNAVTISGAITKNLWGQESAMTANAGLQTIIDRCDGTGTFVSTVENSEFGTEMKAGAYAVNNWATGTVTSTAFADGDYIRVRVYFNDAGGTMASGAFVYVAWRGPTAGAEGDSYVTFTETITEYVPPLPPSRIVRQAVNRASTY